MHFRIFILLICAAFSGCEKDPNAEENQPPAPTPTPRRAVRVLPKPGVTPWAPISKSKPAGPDTTWLYNVPPPPTPTPSQLRPFHSSLEDPLQRGGGSGSKPRGK